MAVRETGYRGGRGLLTSHPWIQTQAFKSHGLCLLRVLFLFLFCFWRPGYSRRSSGTGAASVHSGVRRPETAPGAENEGNGSRRIEVIAGRIPRRNAPWAFGNIDSESSCRRGLEDTRQLKKNMRNRICHRSRSEPPVPACTAASGNGMSVRDFIVRCHDDYPTDGQAPVF
ncbi:hypothetical protein VTN77DRAFT_5219 [Rasamsonia byssochlamydoides]|uniref:uncharacterized protein n=1 Tax=Rasamsonia byssochlamydoides TaxID=89139 RepID=UPI003742F21B